MVCAGLYTGLLSLWALRALGAPMCVGRVSAPLSAVQTLSMRSANHVYTQVYMLRSRHNARDKGENTQVLRHVGAKRVTRSANQSARKICSARALACDDAFVVCGAPLARLQRHAARPGYSCRQSLATTLSTRTANHVYTALPYV